MLNSPNVLIEVWSSADKGVKITFVPYKSAQEAREVLRSFIQYENDKEELKDFADEAYSWGFQRSKVVFIRKNFIVYLEARANVDADPEIRRLSRQERFELEKTEVKRLSKEFAKHVVSAIDLP